MLYVTHYHKAFRYTARTLLQAMGISSRVLRSAPRALTTLGVNTNKPVVCLLNVQFCCHTKQQRLPD